MTLRTKLRGLRKKTVGPKMDVKEFCDTVIMAMLRHDITWSLDERGRIYTQVNGTTYCPLQFVAWDRFEATFDNCYEAGKRIGLPGYLAHDICDAENNEMLDEHAQRARKILMQFLNLKECDEAEAHAPPS